MQTRRYPGPCLCGSGLRHGMPEMRGLYTFKAVRHLALECRCMPRDAAAVWRLRRLLAGRHSVQGSPLGQPAVVFVLVAFSIILGECGGWGVVFFVLVCVCCALGREAPLEHAACLICRKKPLVTVQDPTVAENRSKVDENNK